MSVLKRPPLVKGVTSHANTHVVGMQCSLRAVLRTYCVSVCCRSPSGAGTECMKCVIVLDALSRSLAGTCWEKPEQHTNKYACRGYAREAAVQCCVFALYLNMPIS